MITDLQSGERNWFLIYTKARGERTAFENLQRQGFEVYLPLMQCRRRHRGKYRELVEVMFPRYLFIHLSQEMDNWAPIRSTLGVSRLVCFGGLPARVPETLLATLRSRAEDLVAQAARGKPLRIGDRVRIVVGAMSGYEALFEASTSRERVSLLLDFAGRKLRVQAGIDDIEPVV